MAILIRPTLGKKCFHNNGKIRPILSSKFELSMSVQTCDRGTEKGNIIYLNNE